MIIDNKGTEFAVKAITPYTTSKLQTYIIVNATHISIPFILSLSLAENSLR